MIDAENAPKFQDTVQREIGDLRKAQLGKLILIFGVSGWSYFAISAIEPGRPDGGVLLAVLLVVCGGARWLYRRHPRAASWLVLFGMEALTGVIMLARPSSLAFSLGVFTILAAGMLLSFAEMLLVVLLTWGVAVLTWLRISPANAIGSPGQTAVLYSLATAIAWVSYVSSHTAVEWSLSAWHEVQKALEVARGRRAEILSVARSLDEAMYRIERMNNELIVARQAAELARANKARFAALVSHELRGPLNLILGFSQLMTMSPRRYGVALPASYRADLDTIFVNSQHLAGLVDDILDLSQIDASALPLLKERLDLADVISEVVGMSKALIQRKGLYLRVSVPEGLPPLFADRVRIRQVLTNLLTNAARFTDVGGIVVSCAVEGDCVRIVVQDTGRGIAADDLSGLFLEFARVQMGESPDKGTGLGLAISKYLVELHGGRIWAESSVGIGTSFFFTLPLLQAAAQRHLPMRSEGLTHAAQPYETCLVSLQDPFTVRLLARHIKDFQVVGIPNVEQVPSLAADLHPRAILTTAERKLAIAERLAALPLDIPIITCAISTSTPDTCGTGSLVHLIKPVSREVLEATIGQIDLPQGARVLVVDDDPDAVRLIEIMLTALPGEYHLLKAYDGGQAMTLMADTPPDLVLMDLLMPGMNGEDVITQMRLVESLRNIPVVIISARDPFDHTATVTTPLEVWTRAPLGITLGVRLINSILNDLSPQYLDRGAKAAVSEPESPTRTASSVPPSLQAPAPDRAAQ